MRPWSKLANPIAPGLLVLLGCSRPPTPTSSTATSATALASATASAVPSASASAQPSQQEVLGLLGLGGPIAPDWVPNCDALQQYLGSACLEKLGKRFQYTFREPQQPLALPRCLSGASRVAVRVARGPDRSSLGCGDEFDLTISGQVTRIALCSSACGPAGFHAEALAGRTRVAFSCWADLQDEQGVIALEGGALVIRSWDKASSDPLQVGREAYALPCGADVHWVLKPWSNVPD